MELAAKDFIFTNLIFFTLNKFSPWKGPGGPDPTSETTQASTTSAALTPSPSPTSGPTQSPGENCAANRDSTRLDFYIKEFASTKRS